MVVGALKKQLITHKAYVQALDSGADEVIVDQLLKTGIHPNRLFPRLCFKKAFHYICDHHDVAGIRLVHGLTGRHLSTGHGWVELPGEVIFDGVVQRFFTRPSYRKALRGLWPLVSLKFDEAVTRSLEEKTFGPWWDSREFNRCWLSLTNPTVARRNLVALLPLRVANHDSRQ